MWLRCETNSEEFFVWKIMGGVGGGLDGGYERNGKCSNCRGMVDR